MRLFLRFVLLVILTPALCTGGGIKAPETAGEEDAPRYAAALMQGFSYTPDSDLRFTMASFSAQLDYEDVFPQKAPETLKFKVELSGGASTEPSGKFMGSVNMFAVKYLDPLSRPGIRVFCEGGIGLIYQDFRVEGQGLRYNFNPQLGIGAEFERPRGNDLFSILRLHHVSNADLHEDNTGINSVVLVFGRYF
ncbi:MAG: acyloxyacyl hydrolase [Desulfarculaceae bacterium]|nr:acyloxyacyl hydrolase [Desulfarculaceae bacterium]